MTGKETTKFRLRPNASNGLWLCTLIPLSYMANTWKHKSYVQFQGKVSTIVAFGLFLQTLVVLSQLRTNKPIGSSRKLLSSLPAAFTSFLIWICLNQAAVFSIVCGTSALLLYGSLYVHMLKVLPQSFTFGEASVVGQGFVLFLLNVGLRLSGHSTYSAKHDIDDVTLILQIGLVGVTFIVAATHFINIFRKDLWFYVLVAIVSLTVSVFPIKGYPAVVVLFSFLFADSQRIITLCAALVLLVITVITVIWFLITKRQSNTRTRKLFHILIVATFLPGIIYQCQLLFMTTAVMLALFVVLETARIINLKFVGDALNESVALFVDEKDAGLVALTPIYLLVGCSLPLWLHPCPWCPIRPGAIDVLPLLSGVLSVGVGDTVASVVGSKYGRHWWLNGDKSIEGTVASILAQGLVLIGLVYLQFLHVTTFQISVSAAAVIVNSLVEAHTNQVDNLVLPLVTFIGLSLS
ncbi:dolichol kinase [Bradysia coprophila]|uniref:dolichol kinase n=1 Tax=Bradysia coprophila TaxID=38358 RepID=UPI00187DAE2B|nr:dolichol kinase [Bradysia coprophila]